MKKPRQLNDTGLINQEVINPEIMGPSPIEVGVEGAPRRKLVEIEVF